MTVAAGPRRSVSQRVPVVGPGGRLLPVATSLAARSLRAIPRIPGAIVPVVAMPVFFVIAFGGTFRRLTDLPGFPTDNILSWMAPFAILQGAAFAGLGTAFQAGRDLEGGFADRLLLSPAPRSALLVGPVLASMARALLPTTVVTVIAMIGGARFEGGPIGFVSLVVAAQGVAMLSGLWGLGVVYRLRTQRAGPLIQTGIFFAMFLAAGHVPLAVMTGWLHAVARVNPMTNVLRLARQGVIDQVAWSTTWPGLVALAGGALVLGVFAVRGLRRLVP